MLICFIFDWPVGLVVFRPWLLSQWSWFNFHPGEIFVWWAWVFALCLGVIYLYNVYVFKNIFKVRLPQCKLCLVWDHLAICKLPQDIIIFSCPIQRTRLGNTIIVRITKEWNSLPESMCPDSYFNGLFKTRVKRLLLGKRAPSSTTLPLTIRWYGGQMRGNHNIV